MRGSNDSKARKFSLLQVGTRYWLIEVLSESSVVYCCQDDRIRQANKLYSWCSLEPALAAARPLVFGFIVAVVPYSSDRTISFRGLLYRPLCHWQRVKLEWSSHILSCYRVRCVKILLVLVLWWRIGRVSQRFVRPPVQIVQDIYFSFRANCMSHSTKLVRSRLSHVNKYLAKNLLPRGKAKITEPEDSEKYKMMPRVVEFEWA